MWKKLPKNFVNSDNLNKNNIKRTMDKFDMEAENEGNAMRFMVKNKGHEMTGIS